jgi:hypothetical protein
MREGDGKGKKRKKEHKRTWNLTLVRKDDLKHKN